MRPPFVAAGLFAVAVALRLPFATSHLYAWDSTLYARALEHGFHVTADVATESPHPPGYIWYIALAALFRLFLRDSNAALVAVSIVACAATAAALYLFARRLVRKSVAVATALAFVASPLVWMYSEVAYPYTLLAFLSLALGWWMVRGGRPVLMSATYGVLAGFRQDLLLLLGPLWLWRVSRAGPREALLAVIALAAGCITWALPTVALSGGLSAYLAALSAQSTMATGSTAAAGGEAVSINAVLTGEALFWGVLPFALILAADAVWSLARAVRTGEIPRVSGGAIAWVLWIVPALAFYLFVHIGEWGYVLSIVAPILLASAARIDRAIARAPGRVWAALATVAILVPAILFVVAPLRFSAERLRQHELDLSSRVVPDEGPTWSADPTMRACGWELGWQDTVI